jgi:hypothetical protein
MLRYNFLTVNESACIDVANVEIKMYTGCYNMIVSRMFEPFVEIILSLL